MRMMTSPLPNCSSFCWLRKMIEKWSCSFPDAYDRPVRSVAPSCPALLPHVHSPLLLLLQAFWSGDGHRYSSSSRCGLRYIHHIPGDNFRRRCVPQSRRVSDGIFIIVIPFLHLSLDDHPDPNHVHILSSHSTLSDKNESATIIFSNIMSSAGFPVTITTNK